MRESARHRRWDSSVDPVVWISCGVMALVLTLGVQGTLASWTSALVTNTNNTATTAAAVILQQTQGSNTCASSNMASNISTCTTIDSYGGTAVPLSPGASQTADATFTNLGSAAASSFRLNPGVCTQSPAAGGGTTNLCTAAGQLSVALSCSSGGVYNSGAAWTDLKSSAVPPGSLAVLTHTASLAVNGPWTCRFTVVLSATADVNAQGVVVTQPLTWTLVR